MNLLPKSHNEFNQKDYWDSFFKKRGNKAFEWYGEYPELSGHLHKYIRPQDEILIVGCGNSTLGNDLYDIGYNNITNIDVSPVVIKQMVSLNEKKRPEMKFFQMDATKTRFRDDQFTVVLDKGTLDALMPNENVGTMKQIDNYFQEINRILKTCGRYVCISLLQEYILMKILNFFPYNNWMFRVVRCYEAEKNSESAMPVFMVICTKFKMLPKQLLEVNLGSGERIHKVETSKELVEMISNIQRAAFICSGLKRSSIVDKKEISFDLFEHGEDIPRFTIYVVDVPPERKHGQYAAFIVPQGRETEWLFSTLEGRKHLVKVTKFNRLAIVTLHRGHLYENLEEVQKELNNNIKDFAPANLTEKIPFLSLGSDVGNRNVCDKGYSNLSGAYIIEDVEVDGDQFRRLYFLDSQSVIQSEAKLKTVKYGKKNEKVIVDIGHLTCKHHVYMSIASNAACNNIEAPKIAVIGLGGGGLCMFLRKFVFKAHIDAIDIDPDMLNVATEWFDLRQDDKLNVEICDGIEFLQKASTNNSKYNAVLFDVDSKDKSVGMSCPPKAFLEADVLSNVVNILDESGLFILNVVIRDQSLKPSIEANLKKHFYILGSYKLKEDLNEVFICSTEKIGPTILSERLEKGLNRINIFFKKYNKREQLVDGEEFKMNLVFNVNDK